MKCPRKYKYCNPIYWLALKGKGQFICAGINKKPTKYHLDNIKLCLSGELIKPFGIEMTQDEALAISLALTTVTRELQEKELGVKKLMAKKKKGRMVDLRKTKKSTKKKNKKSKNKKSKKRR